MDRVAGIAALGLALLAAPRGANAQASDEELARAVILFEESERAYNEGDFAEAVAMLRRAYELHPDVTLLFNLGRALEGMGDLDGAIDAYQRYLDEAGDVEDRGAIERRLETLRAQRAQLAGERADAPERGEATARDEVAPPDRASAGGPDVDPAPWIVAGAGVALIGAGIGFGVVSRDLDGQAAAEPVMATAVDLHAQAETYAIVANVFFVAGGLAALGGAVWGVVSLATGGSDEGVVELRISPTGAVLRGRF